ncbi:cytolysin (calcineurin-like family phosphatase) [Luteibacter sp. W1I16]|uniref:metallophosphoesterase n=1 Tax=Luteibacter sp. W1I16 TaxID=3373922 RepID=UPI003D1C1E6D
MPIPTQDIGRLSAALALAVASACLAPTAAAEVRTMIVTSDPQYPWTAKTDAGIPQSDAERNAESEALIEEQYRSIVAYRAARPGQEIPVFINGDITAYGHGDERRVMARLLRTLGGNVHIGLGNHDYENNIRRDNGSGCYNNGCARDSITDLSRHVTSKHGVVSFDFSVQPGAFSTHYQGSLAYAFNAPGLDRVLNLQLHNHPLYAVSFDTTEGILPARYEIESSVPWLGNILQEYMSVPPFGTRDDRAYDFAIVHVHDPDRFDGDFARTVADADVAAIFAGHLHRRLGYHRSVAGVPVFLSGSASQRTYLVVEHDTDEAVLRVYGVRDNDPEHKHLIDTVPIRRDA